VFIFWFSPALKYFKRGEAVERHMLGPLTEPRLLLVFDRHLRAHRAFGLIEVGYPALATRSPARAWRAVLFGELARQRPGRRHLRRACTLS
jgi:hypothetical protein